MKKCLRCILFYNGPLRNEYLIAQKANDAEPNSSLCLNCYQTCRASDRLILPPGVAARTLFYIGVCTEAEAAMLSDEQYARIPGIGKKTIQNIREAVMAFMLPDLLGWSDT